MRRSQQIPTPHRVANVRQVITAFAVFCVVLFALNATALTRPSTLRSTTLERTISDVAGRMPAPGWFGWWRQLTEAARAALDGDGSVELRAGAGTRVLLVGDSMMENVAGPLAAELSHRWAADVASMTRRGSTLGTPELFDWPAEVAAKVRAGRIDVVIVLLDASPRDSSGHPLAPGSRTWADGYVEQVGELTRDAHDAGATNVIWLERPVTADASVEAARAQRYLAVRAGLAGVPGGVFVAAAWSLAGPGGGYTEFVSVAGRVVKVRADDGIHLSPAGASLYARTVADLVDRLAT